MKPSILPLLATLGVLLLSHADAAVIAHWRFENNLVDSSGNGFHAASNAAGFSYATEVPGPVIQPGPLSNLASYQRLNTGTAETTTVAYDPGLTDIFSAGSFTVEAFVYLTSGGSINFLTLVSNRADSKGLALSVGKSISGYVTGTNGAGTNSSIAFGDGLALNQWHHVAWVGTYTPAGSNRGTAIRFYVDGVQVGSTAFYFAPQTNGEALLMNEADWRIGGPGNNFNGRIDELRFSDEALTPDAFLIATIPEPSLTWLALGGAALWFGSIALPRRRDRS